MAVFGDVVVGDADEIVEDPAVGANGQLGTRRVAGTNGITAFLQEAERELLAKIGQRTESLCAIGGFGGKGGKD